jgi:hypothetical protein
VFGEVKERIGKVNKWGVEGGKEALRRAVLVPYLGQCAQGFITMINNQIMGNTVFEAFCVLSGFCGLLREKTFSNTK